MSDGPQGPSQNRQIPTQKGLTALPIKEGAFHVLTIC